MRFHVKQLLLLALGCICTAGVAGNLPVSLPAGDLELQGRLFMPAGAGPFPAIVMLHGCGGLWDRRGEPTASYLHWARHFRDRGFAALLLDSFGPRGEKQICTQQQRTIRPQRERAADAHAALRWLAAREDVRRDSIHLLGWSNGGTTVLHALRADSPGRKEPGPSFRSAAAFYPGCKPLLATAYRPVAPVLIQAGGADDWTPAEPCRALADQSSRAGAQVSIDVYEGAHHSFDRIEGRVRFRPDVRNPSNASGRGATVGPQPEARDKARARVTQFFERHR